MHTICALIATLAFMSPAPRYLAAQDSIPSIGASADSQAAALRASPPDTDSVPHSAHPAASDSTPTRPLRAIEYSDWYYRRLTVHRIASYTELPLFATEYILGERLLHDEGTGRPPSGLRTAHVGVAGGLAVLFGLNTITGVWNLWDSRSDPEGRTRRWVHSLAMLGADAGFAIAGAVGGNVHHRFSANGTPLPTPTTNRSAAYTHRNIAIASMGLATFGSVLMWFRRD